MGPDWGSDRSGLARWLHSVATLTLSSRSTQPHCSPCSSAGVDTVLGCDHSLLSRESIVVVTLARQPESLASQTTGSLGSLTHLVSSHPPHPVAHFTAPSTWATTSPLTLLTTPPVPTLATRAAKVAPTNSPAHFSLSLDTGAPQGDRPRNSPHLPRLCDSPLRITIHYLPVGPLR